MTSMEATKPAWKLPAGAKRLITAALTYGWEVEWMEKLSETGRPYVLVRAARRGRVEQRMAASWLMAEDGIYRLSGPVLVKRPGRGWERRPLRDAIDHMKRAKGLTDRA
jgi:hypothetical protein